jgi:hypothetical protein
LLLPQDNVSYYTAITVNPEEPSIKLFTRVDVDGSSGNDSATFEFKPSVSVDFSLAANGDGTLKGFSKVCVLGACGSDSATVKLPTSRNDPPLNLPRLPNLPSLPSLPGLPSFPRLPNFGLPNPGIRIPVPTGVRLPGLPFGGSRGGGGSGAAIDDALKNLPVTVSHQWNSQIGQLTTTVKVGKNSGTGRVIVIDEEMRRNVRRTYEILGGDRWFEDGDTPKIDLDVETYVKGYVANQWGLEAEKEDVEPAEIRDVIDVVGAITSLNYFRLGLQEFPLDVPENLTDIPEGNEPETLVKIPYQSKFDEWQFKQMDALLGQFPIKIRIEDNDLIKTGDQPLEIKLPNLAETVAELVGKTLTNEALINLLVNMNLRILNETGSAKLQGFKTSKAIEVLTAYFGYEDGKKKEKIRFLYNPLYQVPSEGTANFSEFLKETEIEVIVDELLEKQTLEQKIDNLLYSAAIVRSSMADGVSPNNDRKWGEYVKLFKDLVKSEADKEKKNNDEFDEFIDRVEAGFTEEAGIKDLDKPYGRPRDQRPRIRQLGQRDGTNQSS